MNATSRDLLESPDLRRLIARRWRVSLLLTAALFVLYYGYILLIATNKAFLARRLAGATTIGIPIGAGVIVGAWVLTAIYVVWANRHYDGEVARLRGLVSGRGEDTGRTTS
jgi:uncharacterized membrane protein (DUF485 family)